MINRTEFIPARGKHKTFLLRDIKKTISIINFNSVLMGFILFFVSRASIMDGLTPFGIAFLVAYIGKNSKAIIVPIITSLGVISTQGQDKLQYIFAIWFIFIVYKIMENRLKFNTLRLSVFAGLSFILVKGIYVFINDYFLYDIIMSAFEGIIIFTLTYIFTYSISTIEGNYSKIYTNEEIICGAIMLSLAISGFGELSLLGLSLQNIVGVFLIILFGYNKGPAIGTVVGVTIGVVTSMSTINMPLVISVYGFSGLIAGLFKDIGKIGSSIGFIVGNIIISFYISGFGFNNNIIKIQEIVISVILFLLLSNSIKKISNKITIGISKTTEIEDSYSNRVKDITNKRLIEISRVFQELGTTFQRVADKEKIMEQKDISKFVNTVVDKVCTDCAMCKFCWENDFYTAYQSMFDIMSLIELRGKISYESLPEYFKKRCIRPDSILEQCNYLFDIYKLNYKWENKVIESRQLVSQQLEGISKIINDLASEIHSDIRFKEDVERAIYSGLRNHGIDIMEVIVIESEEENFEIFLEAKFSYNENEIAKEIINVTSEIVGFELIQDKFSSNISSEDNRLKFKLIKANRFGAVTKISRYDESFNYISGDSYTFGERKSNYFVALSDGMGVGQRANQESSITISLLEKFLEAGFDKELALKTINSILVLKSTEEMLATIDISIVDLYRGETQFIKMGSAPTFIKRRNRVEIINSHTLPVGILKDVDFQLYESRLEDGDLIIMMSDGVLDANGETDDKEKWMAALIEDIKSVNPQTVVDNIIDKAKEICNKDHKDDMTVLVTKIWKRR